MKPGRYRFSLILSLLVAFGGLAAVLVTDTSPRLGLDLEGGTSVILTATGENVESDVLEQTVSIIRQRIDALGVAEPEVSIAGTENILVQLPGVEDEQQALEIIGSTAQLTFRQVKRIVPPGAPERRTPEITEERGPEVNREEVVYPDAVDENTLYVLEPARLTGDIVTEAEAQPDPGAVGQWGVSIEMDRAGARTWQDFTSELACIRDQTPASPKAQVAIVLDGRVESAAGMDPEVACDQGIGGGQTFISVGPQSESKQLALVLRTGALPLTLEQSEVRKVSATLGRDSLQAGVRAGAIGIGLLVVYMLLYYRALGLVVWLGLAVFTAAMYSLLAWLGESAGLALTLAGVAGFIASIGITADSFIVAFERLKDEMREGKSLRAAVQRGTSRAIRTMLIADFVTGAAALILFLLAVGPVRGFALILGLATIVDVLLIYFFIRPAIVLLSRSRFGSEKRFIGLSRTSEAGP